MPPRGKTPGLKRGRHNKPYWIASQVRRDVMDFPDKCIPLPPDADMETLSRLCHEHSARLDDWIATRGADDGPLLPRYDGTVYSACQLYQRHPHSRFHKVKHNTRKSYTDSLKIIEATVGKRLIRNLTVLDVQHWYDEWRKPAGPECPERIDRAHDAVSMFKTVLRLVAAALRRPECKQLISDLEYAGSLVKFEKGGAREQEMSYAQATAFIRMAFELGEKGVIPRERALYMAIGVAAQFELLLRQKDVIGEHAKTEPDLAKATRRGAASIAWSNGEMWVGYFTWENIPGWRWQVKTSKSKYRHVADFDLTKQSMLHPLLERVPFDQRSGAVVKGEGGEAIRERSYRKWYRQISRAAGIPDDVLNMDTRAGGATEADNAGAEIELISAGLTHDDTKTTLRYLRHRGGKLDALAEVRAKNRAGKRDGTA